MRPLDRTTRSVSLTAAGEQLAAHLRPAVHDLAEAVEGPDAHRDTPRGRVRTTVSRVAAELVLRPRLVEFGYTLPAIELEVSVSDRFRRRRPRAVRSRHTP